MFPVKRLAHIPSSLKWAEKNPIKLSEHEQEPQYNCEFCCGRCECPTSDPTELNQWMSRDMYDEYVCQTLGQHQYDYCTNDDYSSDYYEDAPEHSNDYYERIADYNECLFYQQELIYKSLFDVISKNDFENEMKMCDLVLGKWKQFCEKRRIRKEATNNQLFQENIGHWQQEQLLKQ